MAFAAETYGSGSPSMRALSCRYCFFCSSDPVTVSIHLAATSVLSSCVLGMELGDAFGQEAPRRPEPVQLFPALGVDRVHLSRRALLRGNSLDVHEPALLDPEQDRVDGSLDDGREALVPQPRRDLVPVRRPRRQNREDDALQGAL